LDPEEGKITKPELWEGKGPKGSGETKGGSRPGENLPPEGDPRDQGKKRGEPGIKPLEVQEVNKRGGKLALRKTRKTLFTGGRPRLRKSQPDAVRARGNQGERSARSLALRKGISLSKRDRGLLKKEVKQKSRRPRKGKKGNCAQKRKGISKAIEQSLRKWEKGEKQEGRSFRERGNIA